MRPVRDGKGVACSLAWDEILSLVGAKIREQLSANKYWSDLFLRNGLLGEPSSGTQRIYKAHIVAQICAKKP